MRRRDYGAFEYGALLEFPRLSRVESLIFKLSCQQAMAQGYQFLSLGDLWDELQDIGIDDQTIFDSIESLQKKRYISILHTFVNRNEALYLFSVTHAGLGMYICKTCRNFVSMFDIVYRFVNSVFSHPSSHHLSVTSNEIADKTGLPRLIIDHILEELEFEDRVILNKQQTFGNWIVCSINNA